MLGVSGSAGERLLVETASARNFPSLTSGTAGGTEPKEIGVWPASAEPIAGPPPLKGREGFADRWPGQRGMAGEHRGRAHGEGEGIEIRGGVVRHVRIERGINEVVRTVDENGVSVRCRLRGATRPDISASAGDVLDLELHAQLLGELLRHQAGEYVGWTGGSDRHEHHPPPPRVSLAHGDEPGGQPR